MYNKFISSSN